MYGLRMGLSISEILLIMAHAPFSIRLQVTLSLRPNSLASPRSQYHLSIIQSLPIGFHLVLSWLSCVAFGKRPRILRVKHCVHSWFCFIRMEVKTILFRSLRSGMQLCLCLWLYYGKKKPIILGIAGLGQFLWRAYKEGRKEWLFAGLALICAAIQMFAIITYGMAGDKQGPGALVQLLS